jgi:hypothetical protein
MRLVAVSSRQFTGKLASVAVYEGATLKFCGKKAGVVLLPVTHGYLVLRGLRNNVAGGFDKGLRGTRKAVGAKEVMTGCEGLRRSRCLP